MPQSHKQRNLSHSDPCAKSFKSYFKHLDIFGYPITFTYKGDTHYRTSFGATLTVLQVMIVLAFMGNELYGVHNRNPSISISNYYLDLVGTPDIVSLSPKDFYMAFSLSSISLNQTLNMEWDRYVSLFVIESEQKYIIVNGEKVYDQPMKYLDLMKCPEGRFDNYTSFTEAVSLTANYYCLVDQNMKLQGSLNSQSTITYYVGVSACNQTTLDYYQKNKTCVADADEISWAIQDLQLFSSFMSKQYNTYQFDDAVDPIEPYVYTHYSFLNEDLSAMYQLSLKTKTAIGTNSYISNSISSYNYTFYETQMSTGWLGKPWGDFYPYVGYAINQNPEVIQITRSNKNLLQALSNTGGLAGVLSLIFRWITTKIYKKKFPIDAANQIYTSYRQRQLGLISEKRNSKVPLDLETSISHISQNIVNHSMDISNNNNTPIPVNFSFKEYVVLKFRSFFNIGMNRSGFKHRLDIYKRGLRSFSHNIDTVKLIKMQRQIKWLLKNILSENQFFAIKAYERKFLDVKLPSQNTQQIETAKPKDQSRLYPQSQTLDLINKSTTLNQSTVIQRNKKLKKKKQVSRATNNNTTILDMTVDNLPLQNSSSRMLKNTLQNNLEKYSNEFMLGGTKENIFLPTLDQTKENQAINMGDTFDKIQERIKVKRQNQMSKKKSRNNEKKTTQTIKEIVDSTESP